jgi:hypothetical protein
LFPVLLHPGVDLTVLCAEVVEKILGLFDQGADLLFPIHKLGVVRDVVFRIKR